MMLAAGGFADNLFIGPMQPTEMHCQRDPRQSGGGGGAATFADGNVVHDLESQGQRRPVGGFEHLAIGVQDEMAFNLPADFGVATSGLDAELRGGPGVDLDVEVHCEGGGVEGRTKICGGCWQGQPKPGRSRVGSSASHNHSGTSLPSFVMGGAARIVTAL